MATRAQVIRAELVKLNHAPSASVWYLREDVWNLFIHGASLLVDVLRVTNKPAIALALDAVVKATNKPAANADDVASLHSKLQELKERVRYITDTNSSDYIRIDAQIDLLMELLKEKKNG